MNRKELKIDGTMGYGQSRLIDWDHVADVNGDLLANLRDGRLLLLVWDGKGMGMPLCNSTDVTAALPALCDVPCCCIRWECFG